MTSRSGARACVCWGACLGVMLWGCATAHAQATPPTKRAKVSSAKDPSSKKVSSTSELDRSFRTSFPLYDRVVFGVSTHVLSHDTTPDVFGSQLTAHWDVSASLEFADEDVWWLLRHRVLDAQLHLTNTRADSGMTLSGALLKGHYLRHDNSSFITVPTLGNIRVPADFDIAVEWEIGRVALSDRGDKWGIDHLDILELDLMLDWIRDPLYRHRFAVGVHGSYEVVTRADDSWDSFISPLSQLSVLYGWDHSRGLVSVLAKAHCGVRRRFQPLPNEGTWLPSCDTQLRAEWTPLSISNSPLSLALRARAHVPFHDEATASVEATLGLRMGINLD